LHRNVTLKQVSQSCVSGAGINILGGGTEPRVIVGFSLRNVSLASNDFRFSLCGGEHLVEWNASKQIKY